MLSGYNELCFYVYMIASVCIFIYIVIILSVLYVKKKKKKKMKRGFMESCFINDCLLELIISLYT
jgi:cytochrome bd-type quinol oxidase subunit 1